MQSTEIPPTIQYEFLIINGNTAAFHNMFSKKATGFFTSCKILGVQQMALNIEQAA